ncbi:carbohydrate sulfotransferase 10-like isoform X2 [Styela clava]|nr:carbohydrate sulfotransferase 10-like isoform X2 [Styela clava]XP_039250039.1 carbohydrate sulfotransferase 10-like isoform X2 [Styela clava]
MEELAKSRNENLRKRCGSRFYNGTIKSGTWDSLPPLCKPKLYYSDKHKLIACTIPKSGSTSWRKALLISDGVVNASSPEEIAQEDAFKLGMKKRYLWLHFKNNSTRTRAEINKRLNEYYRIIVVREPLERIVSAYLDKIVHGRKKYARIALSMHNGTGSHATFEEFVDSIINKPSTTYDTHWDLYESICDPCRLQYNYIVKLETMSQDAKYVSKITGIDSHLLTSIKSDEKIPLLKHKWKTEYQEYLESLPKDKLMKLFNIYSRDYELFGYSIPQFVLSSKNKN